MPSSWWWSYRSCRRQQPHRRAASRALQRRSRVQFFHDKAGEGGATAAKLSRCAYAPAEKTNEGFGHAYNFSTRTPAAGWSGGLVRSCRTGRQTAVLEQRTLHPHPRELLRRLHQHIPPRGSIHQERRVGIAGGRSKLTRHTRAEEASRPALRSETTQTRIIRRQWFGRLRPQSRIRAVHGKRRNPRLIQGGERHLRVGARQFGEALRGRG